MEIEGATMVRGCALRGLIAVLDHFRDRGIGTRIEAAVLVTAALVARGTTTGSVSVFPPAATHLVLDIFGYVAP